MNEQRMVGLMQPELSAETPTGERKSPRVPIVAIAAGVLCLIAGGIILWMREGFSVFADMLMSGLSVCF